MLGPIAASLFGGAPREPAAKWETRTQFVPADGQTAYGFTFDWSQSIGSHSRVSVGYYASEAEAKDALAKALAGMGYEPPHWWQFWRWGSHRLPDDVLRTVSAQKQPPASETNVNESATDGA